MSINILGRFGYTSSNFARAVFVQLLVVGSVICGTFLCVYLVILFNLLMFWYSRPYLIIALYFIPGLAIALIAHESVKKRLFSKV